MTKNIKKKRGMSEAVSTIILVVITFALMGVAAYFITSAVEGAKNFDVDSLTGGDKTAQYYVETFDNVELSRTSYSPAESFVGDNGVVIFYNAARSETVNANENYAIDGKGMMLRNSRDSYIEFTLTEGLQSLVFDYRKAFTGSKIREIETYINDELIHITPEFGGFSGGEDVIRKVSVVGSWRGNVVVKIKLRGNNGDNRQITIDNLYWQTNP